MNVLIVNCFETYETRVKNVYEYLLSRNHKVTILESDFMHMKKEYRIDNSKEGYIYIHAKAYKKNLSIARLKSHRYFARTVRRFLEDATVNLIYVLVPPNTLVKEIVEYKKSNPWVKIIFDVIDLWPEALPIKHIEKLYPIQYWKKLREKYICEADYVITQCDLYQKYIKMNQTKMKTMYFCREMICGEGCKRTNGNNISLAYLGSINNLIDIETIGIVIAKLVTKYKVTVHVVGDGEKKEDFIETVKKSGAQAIYHGVIYDAQTLKKIFTTCDFGINIYKLTNYIGMTMKSMDYFSYNLPIINSIAYDTEKLIMEYNAGINLKDFSLEAVENYRLARKSIDKLVVEKLSLQAAYNCLDEIMVSLFG